VVVREFLRFHGGFAGGLFGWFGRQPGKGLLEFTEGSELVTAIPFMQRSGAASSFSHNATLMKLYRLSGLDAPIELSANKPLLRRDVCFDILPPLHELVFLAVGHRKNVDQRDCHVTSVRAGAVAI
jgi:hypothetical protein